MLGAVVLLVALGHRHGPRPLVVAVEGYLRDEAAPKLNATRLERALGELLRENAEDGESAGIEGCASVRPPRDWDRGDHGHHHGHHGGPDHGPHGHGPDHHGPHGHSHHDHGPDHHGHGHVYEYVHCVVWRPEDAHTLKASEHSVCAAAGLEGCRVEVWLGPHCHRLVGIVALLCGLVLLCACGAMCRRRCRKAPAATPLQSFGSGAVGPQHATPSHADLANLAVPNPPVPVEVPYTAQAQPVQAVAPAPFVYPTLVVPPGARAGTADDRFAYPSVPAPPAVAGQGGVALLQYPHGQ